MPFILIIFYFESTLFFICSTAGAPPGFSCKKCAQMSYECKSNSWIRKRARYPHANPHFGCYRASTMLRSVITDELDKSKANGKLNQMNKDELDLVQFGSVVILKKSLIMRWWPPTSFNCAHPKIRCRPAPPRGPLRTERFALDVVQPFAAPPASLFLPFAVPGGLTFPVRLAPVPCRQLSWVLRGLAHTSNWPHLPIPQPDWPYRELLGVLAPFDPFEQAALPSAAAAARLESSPL